MRKLFFILFAGVFFTGLLCAEEVAMPPVSVTDSQSYGYGGPHAAYTDSIYGVFANPAAVRKANRGSAFELSLGVPQALDMLGRLGDGTASFDEPLSLVNLFRDSKTGALLFGPGISLVGPLAIGYVADGFAFGVWNQTGIDATIRGTEISLGAHADLIFAVSFATEVFDLRGHSLDAGVTVKPFLRAMTTGIQPQRAEDFLSRLDSINFDELFRNAGMPLVAGIGLDAGIMYRWRNYAAVGVTIADIVTRGFALTDLAPAMGINVSAPADNVYTVPFKINLGISLQGRLGDVAPSLPGIVADCYLALMADWKDLLNQHWTFSGADSLGYRNPILNLGFGVEMGLFRFLRLRAGISDMLPALGAGFRFGPFQIDTSLYGIELGSEGTKK